MFCQGPVLLPCCCCFSYKRRANEECKTTTVHTHLPASQSARRSHTTVPGLGFRASPSGSAPRSCPEPDKRRGQQGETFSVIYQRQSHDRKEIINGVLYLRILVSNRMSKVVEKQVCVLRNEGQVLHRDQKGYTNMTTHCQTIQNIRTLSDFPLFNLFYAVCRCRPSDVSTGALQTRY